MKAVILAGGRGTRLAPYTAIFPKPLVPIGDRPILEIILRQLAYYGFRDVTLTVGHLGELIQAYFAHAKARLPPIDIHYVVDHQPTGTAGSLASVPGLDDTFLVMNGDVLTGLDYRRLVAHHHARGGLLTVAMRRRSVKVDFGVIKIDGNGDVVDYIEKPEHEYSVSMGIYVYEPGALRYIEPGGYLDLPQLVLRLLEAGEKVVSYHSDDYWLDIGRVDDYAAAQNEFEQYRAILLPDGGDPDRPSP